MSYCFKIIMLAEICKKCVTFIEKLQKSSSAGDSAPTPPPTPPSPLRNPGYATVLKYALLSRNSKVLATKTTQMKIKVRHVVNTEGHSRRRSNVFENARF